MRNNNELASRHRVGDRRVSPYSDYEPGGAGFVVEEFSYGSYYNDPPMWAIPAWEERGMGNLGGVFVSREAAEAQMETTF